MRTLWQFMSICFKLCWVSTYYFLDIEIGLFDCFSVSSSLHLDMKLFCQNNVAVFSCFNFRKSVSEPLL